MNSIRQAALGLVRTSEDARPTMAFALVWTPRSGCFKQASSERNCAHEDTSRDERQLPDNTKGHAIGCRRSRLKLQPLVFKTSRPVSSALEGAVQLRSVITASAIMSPVSVPKRTLLASLSTFVGVLVLIGSVLYKIPQVVRIARRRSGKGVSVTMYSLETIGTTFSAMYFARKAFAFSSYGELVFVMAQNVVILGLLVGYEKLNRPASAALGILYTALVFLLLSPSIPLRVLMLLQIAAIPILNLARVPQIMLNWRRKGTGELAPITLGLQLLGNVARIFTTIASVRDWLMLTGVCVSTLFNATLVVQWLYYNRRHPAPLVSRTDG
jgi:mannose-P-dolichol utilization defect 1